MSTDPKLPSITEQGKGLAKFTIEVVKDAVIGSPVNVMVRDDVFNERMKQCNDCKYYVKQRCTHCGCFMDKKAKFKVAKCPIGKW